MKKTRILAFLVTICMATTAFLGGTIAKYSTTEDIEDTATVAKWGIQLKMYGSLFEDAYNNKANNDNPVVFDNNENTVSVHASSNAVAPGTVGNTITISLTGTAEVDTKVTVAQKTNSTITDVYLNAGDYATMLPLENVSAQEFDLRKADGNLYIKNASNEYVAVPDIAVFGSQDYPSNGSYFLIQNKATVTAIKDGKYYPVVYTLTDANSDVQGILTAQDAYDYIRKDILGVNDNATTQNFGTNNEFNNVYTLTWAWDFEKPDANAPGQTTTENDPADTILGYLAYNVNNTTDPVTVVKLSGNNYVSVVSGTDYNLSTNFNISITVEQVD